MGLTRNVFLALIAAMFLIAAPALSEESRFRRDFIKSYQANRFDALAFLIKGNKAGVPAEVRGLVKEAVEGDRPFSEKMHLLDIASAMASMHRDWHGDEGLIKEVEATQRAEIKREEDRVAELTKWDKYEKLLGNLVMRENKKALDAKNLAPVIYPHWVHRLAYECKACHQDLFAMKKNSNNVTHALFNEGKLCGACHNGKDSFSSDSECKKCHNAGLHEGDKLGDATKANLKALKEAALKAGGSFKPELLPNGKIPIDRFMNIDWDTLRRLKVYEPVKSINKQQDEIRDNEILFEPPFSYVKNAPFSHKNHSTQARCASCHPEVFADRLGASKVTMSEMGGGKFCGACHGKVAFRFADCNRCRTKQQGDDKGFIKRVKQ